MMLEINQLAGLSRIKISSETQFVNKVRFGQSTVPDASEKHYVSMIVILRE